MNNFRIFYSPLQKLEKAYSVMNPMKSQPKYNNNFIPKSWKLNFCLIYKAQKIYVGRIRKT